MKQVELHGLPAGSTLGVIAGAGSLPGVLLQACAGKGIATFVVAFIGQTDPALYAGQPHLLTRPGRAGRIIRELKARDIRDLVWIGALRRPSLLELRPDWRAAKFYAGVAIRALGDDGLLRAVRAEVEQEGFRLHGIQDFAAGLAGPRGNVGALGPCEHDWPGIKRGIVASQTLGRLDIGQSVVVREGAIIGVEGAEGTDALIRRCGELARRGCILVKTCKPSQDRALDLPAIGPATVRAAAAAKFKGIVFQAGYTLLAEAQELAQEADRHGLFVTGVDVGNV